MNVTTSVCVGGGLKPLSYALFGVPEWTPWRIWDLSGACSAHWNSSVVCSTTHMWKITSLATNQTFTWFMRERHSECVVSAQEEETGLAALRPSTRQLYVDLRLAVRLTTEEQDVFKMLCQEAVSRRRLWRSKKTISRKVVEECNSYLWHLTPLSDLWNRIPAGEQTGRRLRLSSIRVCSLTVIPNWCVYFFATKKNRVTAKQTRQ